MLGTIFETIPDFNHRDSMTFLFLQNAPPVEEQNEDTEEVQNSAKKISEEKSRRMTRTKVNTSGACKPLSAEMVHLIMLCYFSDTKMDCALCKKGR